MALDPSHYHGISDFGDRMALGLVKDVLSVSKFGRNPAVGTTPEDMWNQGGEETLLSVGAAMYISCEDDTATQTIFVQGLDEEFNSTFTTITLTGQTAKILPGLWTRIARAYQVSPIPAPGDNVYIAELDTVTLGVPQTPSKIHARIGYGDTPVVNQTEKALATVPAGKIALLQGFEAGMELQSGASRTASIGFEIQELAAGYSLEDVPNITPVWAPWRRIFEINLKSDGTTHVEELHKYPTKLVAGTNMALKCTASATSIIHGSFTNLIVPDKQSDTFS
jgi:hypothetical protein